MPARTQLKMQFKKIDIEDDPECSFDYVEVVEQNMNGTVLEKKQYCGSTPFTLNSTAAVVTVRFYSDDSEQGEGFELLYAVQNCMMSFSLFYFAFSFFLSLSLSLSISS